MTKPTMWMYAQRRLRSAWASAQSDQSLRCPHEETWVLSYPVCAQQRLWCPVWSESSLCAHSCCWFCHVVAHLIRTSYLPEKVWMQKQQELTFFNISKHVVKSNCGSSFPGAGLFCTYPISLLLKQSCDNNIVNCVQTIFTEVLCCLEPHFKAYTRIKMNVCIEIWLFYCFSVLRSHKYSTHSVINVDANSCTCSI